MKNSLRKVGRQPGTISYLLLNLRAILTVVPIRTEEADSVL